MRKVNRARWAESRPCFSGIPCCFRNNLWTVVERGIAKLVWGREGSWKHVPVIFVRSGISLDVHPEVQVRKLLGIYSATSSYHSSPKILNKQSITCNHKHLLFLANFAKCKAYFPPTVIKGLFVYLFVLMSKHLFCRDFLLCKLKQWKRPAFFLAVHLTWPKYSRSSSLFLNFRHSLNVTLPIRHLLAEHH